MDEQALKAFRRALRERNITAREAMSPAVHGAHAARICELLADVIARVGPLRLGFCWPFRGEIDLRGLVGDWLAQERRRVAALPVVVSPKMPMVFRRWTPACPMVADAYGIDVPAAGPNVVPDCVVMPLVAFDEAGYRLGYGAGHFDRTLAAIAATGPAPIAIGVGFELSRCRTIHPQAHDAPLDWLITEAGAFRRDGPTMRRFSQSG